LVWSSRFVVGETERKGVVGGERYLGWKGILNRLSVVVVNRTGRVRASADFDDEGGGGGWMRGCQNGYDFYTVVMPNARI
jgi:hypothetical protein